ncbi:hypothetical protein FNV43_RR24338 [Rhamnella rubrinervis]|uniref:Reverse transcriptase zinc-binding domain-containing protein n=1 Tax=Rhamnella rubrinervis TaxID=2594499 RepID=A0A8K0DML1_9ROSA|nr:hypothetical protein FNV43_RR24338 [Rhamnella rubrinervis]
MGQTIRRLSIMLAGRDHRYVEFEWKFGSGGGSVRGSLDSTDDVLMFCRGTYRNLTGVFDAIRPYSSLLGQVVNLDKSHIYFGSGVSHQRRAKILPDFGIKTGSLPFIYLGVPLFKGSPTQAILRPIADRILEQLASWKSCTLSMAGRMREFGLIQSRTPFLVETFIFVFLRWLRLRCGRGFSMASKCRICGNDLETVSHLFLTCPYAAAIWDCLGVAFGIRLDASGSVVYMFEKAMEASLSTQVFNLWTTTIVSALSAIWFVRNQGHFGNVFIPLARSLSFIWASIRKANAIKKGTCTTRSLGAAGATTRALQIILVVWCPLPMGWLKVNTDGAADGLSGTGRMRERNTVADALSKIAVFSTEIQWWWGLPDSCTPMHYRNVNGFGNYRFRK